MMEFTNSDPLCLCALLRGFLALHPGAVHAPHDALQLHSLALSALCGLTAPELAFPYYDGEGNETDISEQNKVLTLYLEVLCSAVVETGLFFPAVEAVLIQAQSSAQLAVSGMESGGVVGVRFLAFLASLVLQAEQEMDPDDLWPPGRRLQSEMRRRADELGRLLDAILASGPGGSRPEFLLAGSLLRDLLLALSGICAAITADGSTFTEDGFTLACRMLLTECLSESSRCLSESSQAERGGVLVGLASLAANVGDLHIWSARLSTLAATLPHEELQRARNRLQRTGPNRVPVKGDVQAILSLFNAAPPPVEPAHAQGMTVGSAAVDSTTKPGSLRDIVQHAPKEFRCALDGKLLCDPVIAPSGAVFERSTLMRWFQQRGQVCPHTGLPLRIEDCERSVEIRQRVTAWVRRDGRQSKQTKSAGKRRKA
eukprot:CAMPEP_0178412548 /NCGR_PEP_ID=MMETSP0689_2-20121128/22071_1 /TAXON_ID=160604 /ORGANISM="Amphidinium massartii, Strain CS-259" /LENGTH=427 /DNA_ID=CAMNT_0020033797 /DNA_START=178 /DNA_END=1461 /DNA_ORIENTATION=+